MVLQFIAFFCSSYVFLWQQAHIYSSDYVDTSRSISESVSICSAFLANIDEHRTVSVYIFGQTYSLPPWSVSILPDCKHVAFNTAKVRYPPLNANMFELTFVQVKFYWFTSSILNSRVPVKASVWKLYIKKWDNRSYFGKNILAMVFELWNQLMQSPTLNCFSDTHKII